jgi:hypothetical protein
MGRLVLSVLASNSLDCVQRYLYSKRKGFVTTIEKVVDLNAKSLGKVPTQSCFGGKTPNELELLLCQKTEYIISDESQS